MALGLSACVARVKRYVPTGSLDTELQDAVLERLHYLLSLDRFPWAETKTTVTLSATKISCATPANFSVIRNITNVSGVPIVRLDSRVFDELYPNPAASTSGQPAYYKIGVADGGFVFDKPAAKAYRLPMTAYYVPDDVYTAYTSAMFGQATELAKLTIERWGAADGFRMMRQFDTAAEMEAAGDKFYAALKKRLQDIRSADITGMTMRERLSYLVSTGIFPFQEAFDTTSTLSATQFQVATLADFAFLKSVYITNTTPTSAAPREIEVLDEMAFSNLYPVPAANTSGVPFQCAVKNGESAIWFDRPSSKARTLRIEYFKVPDSSTAAIGTGVIDLVKTSLTRYAMADRLRSDGDMEGAERIGKEAEAIAQAVKTRYELARKASVKIMSPRERLQVLISTGVFPFQEVHSTALGLSATQFKITTPADFGFLKGVYNTNTTTASAGPREIRILEEEAFSNVNPLPSGNTSGVPSTCTLKNAESEIWFDKPSSKARTYRIEYYSIPDSIPAGTATTLMDMAKSVISKYAESDSLFIHGDKDSADRMKAEADSMAAALKERYRIARLLPQKIATFRERMNLLVSTGVLPFQEVHNTALGLSATQYRITTPSDFGFLKGMYVTTAGSEREVEVMDDQTFSNMFPVPSAQVSGAPRYVTTKLAESQWWVDRPASKSYALRTEYYSVPDDINSTAVSTLIDLAKSAITKQIEADVLRRDGFTERADQLDKESLQYLEGVKKRYEIARKIGQQVMSPKERMSQLISSGKWPFMEAHDTSSTLSATQYAYSTPADFAMLKGVFLTASTSATPKEIEILDPQVFNNMFPAPTTNTSGVPAFCAVQLTESKVWFDKPSSKTRTMRVEYYKVPDEIPASAISTLVDLARVVVTKHSLADKALAAGDEAGAAAYRKAAQDCEDALRARYDIAKLSGIRMISPRERMAMLVSTGAFPFQESHDTTSTLSATQYRLSTPANFAFLKGVYLTASSSATPREVNILEEGTFSNLYPQPSVATSGVPSHCALKLAESQIWFNIPSSKSRALRVEYYTIPDDVSKDSLSTLTDLARSIIVKYAQADQFRMNGQADLETGFRKDADDLLKALRERYDLARRMSLKPMTARERLALLVSQELLPFQEIHDTSLTLSATQYRVTTPTNFAIPKGVYITTTGLGQEIPMIDESVFSNLYPSPNLNTSGTPQVCSLKNAEGSIWMDRPAASTRALRIEYYAIPDDVGVASLSTLTDLTHTAIRKFSQADQCRMDGDEVRAKVFGDEAQACLDAIRKRYENARNTARQVTTARERLNWLVSSGAFPFTETINESLTLSATQYRLTTPTDFGIPKSVHITLSGAAREVSILEPSVFSNLYPTPNTTVSGTPNACALKNAEGTIYFNKPASKSHTLRLEYYTIPDVLSRASISSISELALAAVTKYAQADRLRVEGNLDLSKAYENDATQMVEAVRTRYDLATSESLTLGTARTKLTMLASIEGFPFEEAVNTSLTLTTGAYSITTPTDFAILKNLAITQDEYERDLDILDATAFTKAFPAPANAQQGVPSYCAVRSSESVIWVNCPAETTLTLRLEYFSIPDDLERGAVTSLIDTANTIVRNWATADKFRMRGNAAKAKAFDDEAERLVAAMKRRYQLAREEGARIIAPKTLRAMQRGV